MHEKSKIGNVGAVLLTSRLALSLSRRSRAQKIRHLQRILNMTGSHQVLDVGCGAEWGGAQNTLHEVFVSGGLDIQRLVAIGLEEIIPLKLKYPSVHYVSANGLTLPFADKSFDIAYSNAVIEHIFPLSARVQLVCEMLRVARGVFVTTPNKWFPVEVHTRLPLVHWLPPDVYNQILIRLGLDCFARGVYFEPMSAGDLKACFPATIQPQIEFMFLGMTIIAYCIPDPSLHKTIG